MNGEPEIEYLPQVAIGHKLVQYRMQPAEGPQRAVFMPKPLI